MRNIVLTGFMGTGKTEVGRLLSHRLGYALVDIDSEIEKDQRMAITEIFRQRGEPAFRDIETAVIRRFSGVANVVISTGGGAVLRQENMDALREKGIVVCLMATPGTIYRRIASSNDRPLLRVEDPLKRIEELLDARRPYYEKADIVIDTENKSPLEVAEEIIRKVASSKYLVDKGKEDSSQ